MSLLSKTVLVFCATLALMLTAARAESVYWSDNFEAGAGTRWTTNKVWQVGSPTTGPSANTNGFRSYSGSRCVTTGLKGGAGDNVDGRFICTNYNGATYLAIPSADQSPRLRFWQWFSFVNSEGYVEVQVAGSSDWQTISITNIGIGSTSDTGGGVWSRPSLDMSAFAGEDVQIAFHFTSGPGGWGTDLGWYVDDVALVTNQPAFNNPEGFEGDYSDWSVDAGTWQIGIPTSGPALTNGFRAHSGTNCAATILAGNYGWDMDTRLLTPSFTVPATGGEALRFWQWYNFVNARGFVEITTGDGTWTTISQTNESIGGAATASGSWTNTTIDLSSYAGETVQVAFHFQSGPSGFSGAPGWYIDDLALVGIPSLMLPPTITITNGQTFTTTATATNYLQPLSQFTFAFASRSTNAFITTNGVINWTNTATAPNKTNTLSVKVTDDNQPPFSITNSFNVIVWPVYSFIPLNVPASQIFQLTLGSQTNSSWRVDASTDLVTWQTIFTGNIPAKGYFQISDYSVTNFSYRFYRAVHQ